MNLTKSQIIDLLPHREPMLLIDELINIKKLYLNLKKYFMIKSMLIKFKVLLNNYKK